MDTGINSQRRLNRAGPSLALIYPWFCVNGEYEMKHVSATLAIALLLTGCGGGVKNTELVKVTPSAFTAKSVEGAGGQPGELYLNGVISSADKQQVKVTQEVGKSYPAREIKVDKSNFTALAQVEELVEQELYLTSKGTYINIGCSEESDLIKEIKTDHKVKEEKEESLKTNKRVAEIVAICGKVESHPKGIFVVAQKIILKDAVIRETSDKREIYLYADKLELIGEKNEISSLGTTKDESHLLHGPTINIQVKTEISKEGKLSIISKGADFPEPKKTEAEAQNNSATVNTKLPMRFDQHL